MFRRGPRRRVFELECVLIRVTVTGTVIVIIIRGGKREGNGRRECTRFKSVSIERGSALKRGRVDFD